MSKKLPVLLTFDLDDELSTRFAARDKSSGITDPEMGSFGPSVGYKPILKLLFDHQFSATFFVVGESVNRYERSILEIVEAGHELGNHSYSHRSYKNLSRSEVLDEISKANESLEKLTGAKPKGHRSPYWHRSEYLPSVLNELGFNWNGDAHCDEANKTLKISWHVGGILEIPSSTHQGDWANFLVRKLTPEKVLEVWLSRLSLAQDTSDVFTLVCHPFIIGRPEFFPALQGFIRHISNHRQHFQVVSGMQLFQMFSARSNFG